MSLIKDINNSIGYISYRNANIENKQRLLHLICDKVTYDTETGKLIVKLKPIFQALRIVKDNSKYCSEKVTTLPNVSGKTVLDYLTKNIEFSLKNKVTTLQTLIIPNKKAPEGAISVNGASDGTRDEPNYAELAQMCLHETEVISEIEKWSA